MAFHRYPQLIRAFCNMPRFGPPRACSARFGLARGRSPGFGSLRGDFIRPFGLAFAPAPPVPGLASPPRTTRRLILQKARRHPGSFTGAPTGQGRTVSGLFHSPRRGAFHRSLTVLVRYRSRAVFSLGPWSAQLPAGFFVPGGTHATIPRTGPGVSLRGSHPLRRPVPAAFGIPVPRPRRPCRALRIARPTPGRHRRQAVPPPRFGLLPVRSPLLRECSPLLGVLRCFSSPGAPPPKGG